jgi:Gluconate 2-dehydrogenase subunit 3
MSTHAPLALEQHVAATVAALARTLYPHVALPDSVYARVPAKIDEAAREDAAQAQTVNDGVADLDGRGEQPFVERSAEQQLADAKAIEGSDFFELVRSTAVVEIYSDPSTWKLLGYEGPSFAQGGYLKRGFNDLDWLPDPEQEA